MDMVEVRRLAELEVDHDAASPFLGWVVHVLDRKSQTAASEGIFDGAEHAARGRVLSGRVERPVLFCRFGEENQSA